MTRLRVLIVPDWLEWVTGTIARDVARYNTEISATILSGPVLRRIAPGQPAFFDRFDIVHFLCPHASREWLALLSKRVPVVTPHYHVTDFGELAHNLEGDAIVAISSEWVRDLEARGAAMDRVVMIPPGIDTQLFCPRAENVRDRQRRDLGFAPDQPVIGFMAKQGSNDDDRKGTNVFIAAVESLAQSGIAPGVVLVGPGWAEMSEGIRMAGASCAWLPFIEDRLSLARLYSSLDFYWVTSRVEGGPVPLLEAMSSGVPSLSTPVGCAADLGEDGVNMLLLPFDDPRAFADGTRFLWNNAQLRASLAANGRKTILRNADSRVTSPKFREAYAVARRTFTARNAHRTLPLRTTPGLEGGNVDAAKMPDGVPRAALDRATARHAAMLEKLFWAEHLARENDRHIDAARMMVSAWMLEPRSLQPLSAIMRHFLPVRAVRSLVKLKNLLRRDDAHRVESSRS